MIDITTALYNILHSRYGRDVRQSIHDGIYQINENANEALQNAKTMGVGTAISSASSSSTGYVAGNLYLNSSTWDLWQCQGTNSWLNMGNIKGATGAKGTDGVNNFIYIRYSAYYDGTDFTATPTASSQYIGVYYGSRTSAPTNKQDYQWTSYVGAPGINAYVYIRYSESSDGANFVDAPTPLTKYIGFYAGSSSSAPAGKQFYTWSEYVGKSGSGSGDMLASEYAPTGVTGTVDKALAADSATSATNATNASNIKKTNGNVISADTIDADITGTKGMISDEWAEGTNYEVGTYVILDNKCYKKIGAGSAKPGTSAAATIWQETKINTEITALNSKITQDETLNDYTSSVSWLIGKNASDTKVYVKNGVCYIYYTSDAVLWTINASVKIATLPDGIKPKNYTVLVGTSNTGTNYELYTISINVQGEIYATPNVTATKNQRCCFSISYPIE